MHSDLTQQERFVLRFITSFIQAHGYAPSHLEIARGCGWPSKNKAWRIVERLEAKGRIRKAPGKARTIQVVDMAGVS